MPIRDATAVGSFGDWNSEGHNTLIDVLDRACQRFPNQVAFTHSGCHLRYADLDRLSCDFAAYLQHCTALEPGDRFAIQLPNLLQYPVVLFGALRAGLVVVNINPLFTAAEMLKQYQDSGAKGLLVLSLMADKVASILDQTAIETLILTEQGDALPLWKRWPVNASIRYLKRLIPEYQLPQALQYRDVLRRGRELNFEPPVLVSDDLAMLQYTGGTTGQAKGVMLSQGNLVANLMQVKALFGSVIEPGRELMIAPLPLYQSYSITVSCMLMIEIGAQVVLITNPNNIPAFVHELRRWQFTLFSGLSPLFSALCTQPDFHYLNFKRLKLTISGGMALLPDVAEQWQQATGCPIVEGYGLTETSPIICANPPNAMHLGAIGLPVAATEIRLLDEDGVAVPEGGSGELCVRGPQVMQGYWNQPRATDQVLGPDGWLRTGDIASIDAQGYLTLVDRKHDVIHVGGFNVYPNELERVIGCHPDVEDCVVVGVPNDDQGESIKLYLVASNPELTIQQIRQYCRERLTAYKIPSQVEFRTELPHSAVGKTLRRALRDAEQSKRHQGANVMARIQLKEAPLYID